MKNIRKPEKLPKSGSFLGNPEGLATLDTTKKHIMSK
jgi:hypothetical protein